MIFLEQSYNQPQASEQTKTLQRIIERVKTLVSGQDKKLQVVFLVVQVVCA